MRRDFRRPMLEIATLLLLAAAIAPAAIAATPSRPASRPAPKPAPTLEQAVDLMRKGEFPKARAIIEPLYTAAPATRRSRPLVIDHAILDMTQRVYAPRAVKDLLEYFRTHPQNDEAALNVLGASLNVAASSSSDFRRSALFLRGVDEWSKRNALLEQTRTDGHHWGTKWLTPAQYAALQQAQLRSQSRINDAKRAVEAYKSAVENFDESYAWYDQRAQQFLAQATDQEGDDSRYWAAQAKLSADRDADNAAVFRQKLQAAFKELAAAEKDMPRPDWPSRIAPLDAGEFVSPTPETPPPPPPPRAPTRAIRLHNQSGLR